jgi:hypothetical protein
LIRLGLTWLFLEIDQLGNSRILEDMVTSSNPGGLETKSLKKIHEVWKLDVPGRRLGIAAAAAVFGSLA